MGDCTKERNSASCTCTYDPCGRKGECCRCISYHLRNRELPGCCFPPQAEKTFDRSFEHFASLVSEKKV